MSGTFPVLSLFFFSLSSQNVGTYDMSTFELTDKYRSDHVTETSPDRTPCVMMTHCRPAHALRFARAHHTCFCRRPSI